MQIVWVLDYLGFAYVLKLRQIFSLSFVLQKAVEEHCKDVWRYQVVYVYVLLTMMCWPDSLSEYKTTPVPCGRECAEQKVVVDSN